jgi:predicted SAM-dependent methyltransferase
LRHSLPIADDAAHAVFHEFMLGYLNLRDAFTFTLECLRVLEPGGIMRIGVPDAGACLDSYFGKGDSAWADSHPTGMLSVQALFYNYPHRSMYDAETLQLMCWAAGFTEVVVRDWGQGWIQPSPDAPHRRDGSLYVEARKTDQPAP